MTRFLEDLSLEVIGAAGIPTPRAAAVTSAGAAAALAAEWSCPVVVKALVPAGGRQKGGFVRFADTPADAASAAAGMLGQTFRRFPVERLLVAERVAVRREMFLSITFDSAACSPIVLLSAEGGVDVEVVARERPEAVVRHLVDITVGLDRSTAREIAATAGLDDRLVSPVADVLVGAYHAFRASDARLLEINPLVEAPDGQILAASAVLTVDDQARFRQEALFARDRQPPNNGWRPLTPLELELREIDRSDPSVGDIRFNELEGGDIGLMITGGGGGLVALDAMNRAGGRAATTFDIKIGQIEEKMYRATLAVLRRPGLRGLVAGANFSNFTGIDIKARGVVRALIDSGLNLRTFPVVMRLCGPNQAVAEELVATVPGLEYLDHNVTLEDAVERIVARAYAGEAVAR